MQSNKKGMRTFITIWLGQLASMLGSGLIGFALAVWIFDQTGQATPFALTALFSMLPRILLSPVAGAVTDRWNRKKIMLISDSLSGMVTLATAYLLLTGQMELWMIYLISFIGSVFASFQEPAYSASIVMLVSKDQLTRANSMVQMGQALEMILTPILAGVLFAAIGLRGIIIIDLVTYLIAFLTLLLVQIPQPEVRDEGEKEKIQIGKDIAYGWCYLMERRGLMGLLLYFASVNFFLNISAVMIAPLVLSFSSVTQLGLTQTLFGVGSLAGSLLMSIWGGFKTGKIKSVIGFISLASLGFIVAGLKPSIGFIGAGIFILTFFIPFSAASATIFAEKVPPEVQGRVFATRSMIAQSMMPLAFISSGLLVDKVFNPLMVEGGKLSATFVGEVLGVGAGRGIGLMMVCSGMILLLISAAAYANPRIRNIESEIPDAIPADQPRAEEGRLPSLESEMPSPATR